VVQVQSLRGSSSNCFCAGVRDLRIVLFQCVGSAASEVYRIVVVAETRWIFPFQYVYHVAYGVHEVRGGAGAVSVRSNLVSLLSFGEGSRHR
jgi:hypothetical protein